MEPRLRIRNLNSTSEAGDFFSFIESPTDGEIETAIKSPKPPDGICLYGDLLFSHESRSLRFYLGVPGRAVVVYNADQNAPDKEWIRTDSSARTDLFLICPDFAPDEFYKLPHSLFIPIEEAVRIATGFVTHAVELDSGWEPFSFTWIDYEDTPFYPARSEPQR